jgi:hypothetical protein
MVKFTSLWVLSIVTSVLAVSILLSAYTSIADLFIQCGDNCCFKDEDTCKSYNVSVNLDL